MDFDVKHWENVKAYLQRTQSLFVANANDISRLYESITGGHPFDLSQHPQLKRAIELSLRRMARDMEGAIVNGIHNEWVLSNNKNDYILKEYLAGKTLPSELQEKYMSRHMNALTGFIKRTEGGMGLSDRIWTTVRGHAVNIERELALGIYDGVSAKQLASDMKKHLNEPDRLFRRVRDASGELRLSQPARAYEPGRGKYRSAYKNALRLTRTETNMAYQKADAERWKDADFVLGVRVQRSSGAPYDCDICEAGAGDYPKDYEWTNWHPNCLCYATSILAPEEELDKHIEAVLSGREHKFTGYIKDMPENMKEFMDDTGFKHWGH